MPLAKGSSKKVIRENIRECMHSGKHPIKQCVAMSYSSAGKARKRR